MLVVKLSFAFPVVLLIMIKISYNTHLQNQIYDRLAEYIVFIVLGSLTIDLNRFPRGAKSTRRCGLDMLKTDGSVRQMSIFRNRRVKGWWPFTRKNDDQEFELTVSCIAGYLD